eukprot:3439887-Pyramimonas_sp.AAC.1
MGTCAGKGLASQLFQNEYHAAVHRLLGVGLGSFWAPGWPCPRRPLWGRPATPPAPTGSPRRRCRTALRSQVSGYK